MSIFNPMKIKALSQILRKCVESQDQWRICFVWRDDDAYEVEIVDYHA